MPSTVRRSKVAMLLLLFALSLCSIVSGFNIPTGSTHHKQNNRLQQTTNVFRKQGIATLSAGVEQSSNDQQPEKPQSFASGRVAKILRYSTLATLLWVAFHRIPFLNGILNSFILFSKSISFPTPNDLRDVMVPILDGMNNATGQAIYVFCMLLWTMTIGITTPVETAAGMAFGVRRGILCNALGKMGGATMSFILGRNYIYDYVTRKLADNEILQLVQESIQGNPLGVSLLIRFCPLPEFAKNFGLSILPVQTKWFVLAVLIHGLPYTLLWTSMGAETVRVMRGGAPSLTFGLVLTVVTWFGILVPPPIIGLWIKGLRAKQQKRNS
mmetsp:Transcript_13467/g.20481  ORF Transcript_13467/g.20481 Transcript_13467/m.20481 type:complete len:327 (-) Transcript_13467:69-1049(-)